MKKELQLLKKEDFEKLGQMEKRVAIARDVIARISAGKIKAEQGYLFNNKSVLEREEGQKSLQTIFNENTCEVCAKGGLICSWVGNFNKYNNLDMFDQNILSNHYPVELIEIFGRKLLDAIEACFEGQTYSWHDGEFNEFICKFVDENCDKIIKTLYNKYKSNSNRLKAIMKNIIDNGGSLQVTKELTIG